MTHVQGPVGVVSIGVGQSIAEMVFDTASLEVVIRPPSSQKGSTGATLAFSATRIVNLSFPGSKQGYVGLAAPQPDQKEEDCGCGDKTALRQEGVYTLLFLPEKAKEPSQLRVLRFMPSAEAHGAQLEQLFQALEDLVYPSGGKKMMAFVSPVSGKGVGLALFNKHALPLLQESRHSLTVVNTTHREHAMEWCRDLRNDIDPAKDVIVASGGDGMLFEVINGLKQRARLIALKRKLASENTTPGPPVAGRGDTAVDRTECHEDSAEVAPFAFPLVGTFPTGSGCAMAVALDVMDYNLAVLSLIHCHSVHVDLMKITQAPTTRDCGKWLLKKSNKAERAKMLAQKGQVVEADPGATPIWSMMTVTVGFVSDIDRTSEKWRWMGNTRFTAYAVTQFIQGIPSFKSKIKYVPSKGNDQRGHNWGPLGDQVPKGWDGEGLQCTMDSQCECQKQRVQRKDPVEEEEQWISIKDEEMVMTTLQNMPYTGRDLLTAPYSHLADGSIHIMHSPDTTFGPGTEHGRKSYVDAMDALETGSHLAKCNGLLRCVRASKVLIEPAEGIVMVDGEVLDFHGYLVEIDAEGIALIRSRLPEGGSHKWPRPKV